MSDDFDIAKHVGILRSNLSEAELGLIYFKSLTRDGMALKAECERISIFKDLRSTSLIREESITQFKRWAFEGNDNLISLYTKITSEGRQEEAPYIEDNLKS
ncbi:hypothetical protein GCM10011332_08220 [Terasakiella brassicae]|uniref:Uncharacterized protein n=1 Tax=Terasakiella brassicae TaxID=1634917 RepID=A0A917F759_9PROT|nr:hypothetical protein GCM10011332_08220 [Terasakiella brassicae]